MSRTFKRILIANRGEIAIRITQTLSVMGIESLVVYAEDDSNSLHTKKADVAIPLEGKGVKAYLDINQLIDIAINNQCDAIHPGYGFLSENIEFSRQCEKRDVVFIGANSHVLSLLGDKARARELSISCEVPLVQGLNNSLTLDDVIDFFKHQNNGQPIMIKALAGGGGRGIKPVSRVEDIEQAYYQCQKEALTAFGCGDLYVEQLVQQARHIEIQVIGDGTGAVNHLWERECTLQRNHQKLMEVAPSPTLDEDTRQKIIASALKLASTVKYQGLGTFEFLLDATNNRSFYFMEANPRIQVEHTVTEEITGLDLVQIQVQLAQGSTLAALNLVNPPIKSGYAMQVRINAELMDAGGKVSPATGVLTHYQTSTGIGVRVDGYGYQNYHVTPVYDSLIAKLIVKGNDYLSTINKIYRALCEFTIEGVDNNKSILLNLLQLPQVKENNITTTFVEQHLSDLFTEQSHPELCFTPPINEHTTTYNVNIPYGCEGVVSPSVGVLVELCVNEGDIVFKGQTLAHLEAMKMEFPVKATHSGTIVTIAVAINAPVNNEQLMFVIAPSDVDASEIQLENELDLDAIREDLSEVLQCHEQLYDDARPKAVQKRHVKGMRTARENLDHLLDEDSFNEYGAMLIAAQRKRFSVDELRKVSPADGLVAGTGTVNNAIFDDDASRCIAMSYDYTVFAGTQGVMNHKKMDRMLGLAQQWCIPVILFAEGGGGRPSDTDFNGIAGLDCHTFVAMAALSGLVPTIGIAAGRCFAGNAALLGVCDVVIATKSASIGMAGPAMIEGGGLGTFSAEDVGPASVQSPNGVIDILVEDEKEAVDIAKKYLSYFQGKILNWQSDDQRKLRHYIPQNRMRIYNIRDVISTIADNDSVLEIRHDFAPGIITSFIRIEGKPFGLIANNPSHLGGAIDAASGDKMSRFMRLCDSFDIPMISLCDTPGFMVGPEAEKQATVRHIARIFVAAGRLTVPFFTLVLRKGYGLGAQAMAAGSMHSPVFTASWPTGEFGAMGVEGAISLAFSKQLAAIEDIKEREKMFKSLVDKTYESGKALNMASYMEIDAVIDPLDTRKWILRGLKSTPQSSDQTRKKHSFIDTW